MQFICTYRVGINLGEVSIMLGYIRRQGSKLFRFGSLFLAFLLVVLIGTLWKNQRHHDFSGRELTLKIVTHEAVVMVDHEGAEATLTGSTDLLLDGGVQTIRYMDRMMQCTVVWSSGNYLYTFSDGTSFTLPP